MFPYKIITLLKSVLYSHSDLAFFYHRLYDWQHRFIILSVLHFIGMSTCAHQTSSIVFLSVLFPFEICVCFWSSLVLDGNRLNWISTVVDCTTLVRSVRVVLCVRVCVTAARVTFFIFSMAFELKRKKIRVHFWMTDRQKSN